MRKLQKEELMEWGKRAGWTHALPKRASRVSRFVGRNLNGAPDYQNVRDIENMRKWAFWQLLVLYVNRYAPERDSETLKTICKFIGLQSSNDWIVEAEKDRDSICTLLLCVADPGRDHVTDKLATGIISEHSKCIQMSMTFRDTGGRLSHDAVLVDLKYPMPHGLLDFVVKHICDSVELMSATRAAIPASAFLRICDKPGCLNLFLREGKRTRCHLHRDQPWKLPPEINRRRKWVHDQIRWTDDKRKRRGRPAWRTTAARPPKNVDKVKAELKKMVDSGRLKTVRDGRWKEEMAQQIYIDLNKGVWRSPSDYVPYKP